MYYYFLTLLVLLLLFIGGCKNSSTSSNDDNDTETLDGTEFNYYMTVFSNYDQGKEGSYYIYVYKEKGDEITSLLLSINGVDYEMYHEPFMEGWIASEQVQLNPGEEYNFNININENLYSKSFSLTIPYKPEVNWPETVNIEESTQFNWTLGKDAMYQEFNGYADKGLNDETESNYKVLSTSARSFTMPANWLPKDYDTYSFDVFELNYYKDGNKFLAVSGEGDGMDYYNSKNRKQVSIYERMKNIRKIVRNIK